MSTPKLLIPLVGLAVGAAALLSRSKEASAAPGISGGTPAAGGLPAQSSGLPAPTAQVPGATTTGIPADIINRMVTALASGSPATILAAANELERLGYKTQADDLRAAAADLQKSASTPSSTAPMSKPTYTSTSPGLPQIPAPVALPKPVTTPVSVPAAQLPQVVLSPTGARRFVTVKSGEGPYQITARVLGASQAGRWKELVAANVPPKTINKSSGNFTSLNIGERLVVPANWPDSPHLVHESGTPVASVPTPASIPAPAVTATPTRRLVTVLKGEGPYQITARVLGASQAGRWKELVAANVPPKKRNTSTGNFTTLNVGEKLLVPDSWPDSPQIVFGADPHERKKVRAGQVALGLHFGKLRPEILREWQAREGLPPSGMYGITEALCLCYRYGFVPPTPAFIESLPKARNFVDAMKRRAKQDPQRADEYGRVIRETIGMCR